MIQHMQRRTFLQLLAGVSVRRLAGAQDIKLPLRDGSVRFGVIGDNGTGEKPQYEVAEQMVRFYEKVKYEFVIMLGDNIYGGNSPGDFKRKFEDPYKKLLDAGVKFYASLGNHDNPNQRFYKPFNMDGKRYYDYRRGNVAFFALDSNYMDPEQLGWLRKELSGSDAQWKICYFHHPLYSDSKAHGSDTDLRKILEPIFKQYGVRVVFSGHEHTYERVKSQEGIYYFVLGNSGQLRVHNLRKSPKTEKGFDTDRGFGMVEVAGGEFYFQIVSRTGETIDAGMYPAATLDKGKAA
jgi:3',5'-cyclic AMP phosphodiesterase CpdA